MKLAALRACDCCGSQAEFARRILSNPRCVSNWIHREGQIPATFCVDVQIATNHRVTVYDLRPDVFTYEMAKALKDR